MGNIVLLILNWFILIFINTHNSSFTRTLPYCIFFMSQNHLEITKNMSFNSILCCHQTLILLSVLLLFTSSHNNYLCSANDQLNNNSTDGFFTISSFTYPQATLKPFDFHYIRGMWSNSHSPFSLYVLNVLFLMFMKVFLVWILMGWNWISSF
jgi:hypothetical protein